MRYRSLSGFVIKVKNFGESDKIITLFTKEMGKIGVIAKGVRKISSRRGGNLDLLNEVRVGVSETRGLPILTEVHLFNSHENLKKDLEKTSYAYTIVELVGKFLQEEEPNEGVYGAIGQGLSLLERFEGDLVLSSFESRLLHFLGFDPVSSFCANCFRDYESSWKTIKFNFGVGGVVCDNCKLSGVEMTQRELTLLKEFKSVPLSGFGKMTREELLNLSEIYIRYVEFILESPIRSLKIFANVRPGRSWADLG